MLGLVPDCDLDKVKAVGNAAGTGARMALLNRDHRREIEETVTRIEKIETALEPKFQEHFVNAMAFPNKVDAFPKLTEVVKLPERSMDTDAADGIEPEIIADAAMITAIRETVRALGEDQAEALVESLRGRILAGEFSPERTLQ
mgnify:CR=1 FL=1